MTETICGIISVTLAEAPCPSPEIVIVSPTAQKLPISDIFKLEIIGNISAVITGTTSSAVTLAASMISFAALPSES